MNFMGSIIAIEELAKVDPAVSVMVDVQNTLVNIGLRKWGSEGLKNKYLPLLAQEKLVNNFFFFFKSCFHSIQIKMIMIGLFLSIRSRFLFFFFYLFFLPFFF